MNCLYQIQGIEKLGFNYGVFKCQIAMSRMVKVFIIFQGLNVIIADCTKDTKDNLKLNCKQFEKISCISSITFLYFFCNDTLSRMYALFMPLSNGILRSIIYLVVICYEAVSLQKV